MQTITITIHDHDYETAKRTESTIIIIAACQPGGQQFEGHIAMLSPLKANELIAATADNRVTIKQTPFFPT